MQTWRWLAVAAIVTVAVDGILLLINSVVSAGKPFDTNQFFVLFQTLIALLAGAASFGPALANPIHSRKLHPILLMTVSIEQSEVWS